MTLALRRCVAGTFIGRPVRDVPRVGPAVLVLSPELQMRPVTSARLSSPRS
ncbi:MAG TPA: hypothetical protein VHW04_07625 [Solirubrobacteraceae bacterium]|nr:hypothetical protein [Solirubrobacteraceae bacterium]